LKALRLISSQIKHNLGLSSHPDLSNRNILNDSQYCSPPIDEEVRHSRGNRGSVRIRQRGQRFHSVEVEASVAPPGTAHDDSRTSRSATVGEKRLQNRGAYNS